MLKALFVFSASIFMACSATAEAKVAEVEVAVISKIASGEVLSPKEAAPYSDVWEKIYPAFDVGGDRKCFLVYQAFLVKLEDYAKERPNVDITKRFFDAVVGLNAFEVAARSWGADKQSELDWKKLLNSITDRDLKDLYKRNFPMCQARVRPVVEGFEGLGLYQKVKSLLGDETSK